MSNPIYNSYDNSFYNPFSNIMEQAEQLRKQINGNPREIVQNLLNSGQMSQSDFNKFAQIAQQITGYMQK